ncbi:ankyrin repeat-containing domain protein [Aspergillus recurvatus]
MDPLSITTGVAGLATLAYQIIGYLGTVRAGGKDRLNLCREVTYLWMSITSLLEQLSSDAIKDDKIPDSLRSLFDPDGILKEIKIQLEDLEHKIKSRSSHGKIAQTLAWPFTQKDAERTIERVHRLKTTLQDGINQSTHALSQDFYRDGQSVKNVVDESRLKELIDWISPLNFITKQSMIWNEHHKGTCKWFLERDDFREWREGSNTRIFCPGIPGAGKTFLSSIVYNELEGLRVREEGGLKDAAVVMLYCKWDDPLSQDIDNLLASIIKQFVQRYDVGTSDMMELFTKHSKEGTRPSRAQLQSTLELLYGRFAKVFIILDGLDELKAENERLPLLTNLAPNDSPNITVNLMVTSRPLPNIVRHFRHRPSLKSGIICGGCGTKDLLALYHCAECEDYDLCQDCYKAGTRCGYKGHAYNLQFNAGVIPIAAVEEDLTTYVHWRTSASDTLQQFVEVKEGLMDAILDTVVRSNEGMFLLAKFNMDTLESKLSIKQLMAALKALPQELDGTYEDAMLRITELKASTRETVMRFLCWVVFAEQRLQERAIEHALAVSDGDTDMDDDNIIRARTLATKCAGLVQLDESDCLRLVHYSAENYFRQHRDRWFPTGNVIIASSCLTYLQFDVFRSGACSGPSEDIDFEKRLGKYPFLRYASINWGKHLRVTADNDLFARALALVTDAGCLATIAQALWYLEDQQQSNSWSSKNGSAIHLAAHFNLNQLVKDLIAQGYDPNTPDINGVTPLALAAQRDLMDVLVTLTNAGSSVNQTDSGGRSPLHWAILDNLPDVVKFLLDQKDIDVNIPAARWSHYTPLMLAAVYGYDDSVFMLLANPKIDVNKECANPEGATALILAARQGATGAVKLLLAHPDIDINHPDSGGSTALTGAAEEGYYDVVGALLDAGADTEVQQEGSNGTAIMRAIDNGHASIVQLLVDRGANVHHKDVFDRGLLHSAAVNRQAEILRILLKHDPTLDVNMQDVHGKTTLHDIARRGDLETVDVLLEAGGDPTIKDNHGRTPILVAHESHHPAILEMFRAARERMKAEGRSHRQLQRTPSGTTVDSEDFGVKRADTGLSIHGTLPLWSLVVSKQLTELKERLPESSPEEINQVEPDMGQAALHWAIEGSDNSAVKLLIDHGADINLQNRYGRTPLWLSAAEWNDNWGAARLLLDAGADPDIEDQWGYPPLWTAGPGIGILLIEKGARLPPRPTPSSTQTNDAGKANDDSNDKAVGKVNLEYFLRYAAKFGSETSIRRLVQAGADVWSKDPSGKTPYMIAKENGYNDLANLLVQLAPMPQPGANEPGPRAESAEGTSTSGTPKNETEPEATKVDEVDGFENRNEKEDGGGLREKDIALDGRGLSSAGLAPAPVDIKTKPGSSSSLLGSAHGRHLYTLLLVLILVTATALVRLH